MDPWLLAALIVSFATAIGLGVETWFLRSQLKQSRQNQYDDILRKSMGDLYEVYQTDSDVKTKDECELFATRILDILAILAHLNTKQKREDLLEFVKFDLQIAKGIMKWFDTEDLGAKYDKNAKLHRIKGSVNLMYKNTVSSLANTLICLNLSPFE